MLKVFSLIFFTLIIITSWKCNGTLDGDATKDSLIVDIPKDISVLEKLKMLPGVEVEEITYDKNLYKGGFKLMVKQPLDHNDTAAGYYWQRLYLTHLDENKPMVMYLDGYGIASTHFRSELADFLDANHIHVEHRFFNESAPDTIPWQYLNIWQAAADDNRIVRLLKNIYKDKWVSTGISKGGQTAIYHKRFYPNDVDVAVPIVAPLNLAVNDERIYKFLDNVGTKECRDHIKRVQLYLLQNRDETYPVFKDKIEKYKYEFTHNLDTIFELCVFEFEFAYWQWIADCRFLPDTIYSPKEAVNLLFTHNVPDFFEKKATENIFPFLYQSYTQTGLYGYNTLPFREYTIAYKTDVDNYETFIPKTFDLKFDPAPMKDINTWLKDSGNNFIYVYGECDAWSSTAVEPGNMTNALKIVKEAGTHRTRISNLPEEQKQQVLDSLSNWLDRKIFSE